MHSNAQNAAAGRRVLVTGAGGMLGRKLAARIAAASQVTELVLTDLRLPPDAVPAGARALPGDIADPACAARLAAGRPEVVFHLAAAVSGAAEADMELGYRVNLDGARLLFEAIRTEARATPYRPRVVFASSIAVYGGVLPDPVPDDIRITPANSYGTQKAMVELMLADHSRRGILDGIALRLPTVCIRPGPANAALSGVFSTIMREPLAGREAVLTVPPDIVQWHVSPRRAVDFLLHAAEIDLAELPPHRALAVPGVAASAADQIAALRRVAGDAPARLIRTEIDVALAWLVHAWPRRFDARSALALGFRPEPDFDAIIRTYLEDDWQRVATS